MAAPANINEFLELIRKSGIVDLSRLDTYVDQLRGSGTLTTDLKKFADGLVRDAVLTQFQAEELLKGKWRRFTIGKYKILERIGSGGMGNVYLCEHKLMRRRVAVKVLPTAKAAEQASLERFYREARAAAALDHPNIVHAYDIDQDETLHFLVMEYVDGASLQEIVKRTGKLNPIRAAHYVRQAAIGLDHAHKEASLIHRDIKPGNVLVDRAGVVKILDMGLARFSNDEEDMLTRKYDENVLGTADYLAPEQALDSHNVDIRADIYSLGATFYFMLSGRTPFGEGTTAQKLIWHQTRQPKPITQIRSDMPAGLADVLEKMMAKDPKDRYQTPAEVAEALAPWTGGSIAPPMEAEMPRLSLAATGGGHPSETIQGSGSTVIPPSGPRKSWQLPAATPAKTPASSRAPRSPKPSGSPPPSPDPKGRNTPPGVQVQTPTPRAAPKPGRASAPTPREDESLPWGRVAGNTEEPSAKAGPAPQADAKPRPTIRRSSLQPRPASTRRGRFWPMTILVVALLFGTFVLAGFAFGLFGKLFGR
jgi:serine/threonine protein kinase